MGVTAGAEVVTPAGAIAIGLVSGVVVVFSVLGFDRVRVDDPVGALSVHLVCGVWGTLAVGIFGNAELGGLDYELSFGAQAIGVLAVGVFSLVCATLLFGIIQAVAGLRVSEEEELGGLDIGEHGMEASGGFQIFTTM